MESRNTWARTLHGLHDHLGGTAAGSPGRVAGLKAGARPFFIYAFLRDHPQPSLILLPNAPAAERFAEDLRFFFSEERLPSPALRRIHYFPAWDVPPFEDVSPPADVIAARVEGLFRLGHADNPIILTTPEALLLRVPPRLEFADRCAPLRRGDTIDRDTLAAQLTAWGYRHMPLVEDRGEFTVRGGIVDVFPPAHDGPVRLQLDGDTIDAMHDFDPISQRLHGPRAELLVLPVREFDLRAGQRREIQRAIEDRAEELEIGRQERRLILEGLETGLLFPGVEFCLPYFHPTLDTAFDYLPANTVVWVDNPVEVEAAFTQAWAAVERRAAARQNEHRFYPPPERIFVTDAEWRAALAGRRVVEFEPLDLLDGADAPARLTVKSFSLGELQVKRVHQRHEVTFAPVAEQIRTWCAEGSRVFLVAGTEPQCERLARLLEGHEVPADITTAPFGSLLPAPHSRPRVVLGHLSEGFRIPDEHLVVATEADLFGETRRRAAPRVSVAQLLKNLSELKPDAHVVHLDHGVGIYRGLKHLTVAGIDGDYLHLEYAGGDRLYLPVDRISLVQKYVGGEGTAPAVDRLGSGSWARVKHATRESILAMAKELLAIYAAREVHERKGAGPPDAYFREFEAAFPFEETPDQRQAIEEVVADLQREKPMDRLICGDVGYGKTEVAIRAAFLAAMDGRQVAVLVPTTVLAQQHLATFRRRFDGYPVRVEMLSRFLTPAQCRAVLRGVRDGRVDVVIGTHRLLQADVHFKRLGLLVIDEEHRFGVRHKERIKELRTLVDVLTLTATPIPRTLQMSLMGIRDLSVIETPPVDRLAIRTYVTRYDEDVIRDAIGRELRRGGQVFFVHNRVENIDRMAHHLSALVPEAAVAVGHGQMHERALEKVMLAFLARETNVLVCSAIIESGLDIPNANTIIINRADHFGLAQLYQLRGRVGRSHERAYAYLMIPGEHLISKDAQKRLRVLQELDDLGGGFRLAAHDLEIRGAGNMLGKQQSGHIAAVGFELYTQMMEDAVNELRGGARRVDVDPEIQLGIPAYIPNTYISDENQRLTFYRRLAAIESSPEIEEIAAELQERYGPIPALVDTFLRIMDLRRGLKDSLVIRAVMRSGAVTLQFHTEAPVDVDTLLALAGSSKGKFKLSADYQLSFTPDTRDWDGLIAEVQSVLQQIRQPSRGKG